MNLNLGSLAFAIFCFSFIFFFQRFLLFLVLRLSFLFSLSFKIMSKTTSSSSPKTQLEKTIDRTLIPTNNYYLYPDVNPGALLVSPPLNGDNYHSCSCTMFRALLTENKHNFVDGLITSLPKTDDLYEAWQGCNTTIVSIGGYVCPHFYYVNLEVFIIPKSCPIKKKKI